MCNKFGYADLNKLFLSIAWTTNYSNISNVYVFEYTISSIFSKIQNEQKSANLVDFDPRILKLKSVFVYDVRVRKVDSRFLYKSN